MATTRTKKNKANLTARNATVMAGIQKHLATMTQIQLAGVTYTPASLTAVFQSDSDAIAAATTAHTQWQQNVATQKATNKATQVVLSALRRFLLSYFGTQAVAVLGDFGFTAPKTPGVKTAAAEAASVAKAKATRAARGTKGSVQLDAMVEAGTLGDRDAVGAIAIAFGPMLLDEARAVLGEEWKHEAGDVLQDLTEALMDRRLRFRASRGSALPFLRGTVRGMARRLRKRLEKTRELGA